MEKPLLMIVDPQHPDHDIEERICGDRFNFEFASYDKAPGTPLDDEVYGRADAWLNYRGRHRITSDIIAKMTRCKIIVTSGVGYDHIDLEAAAASGIPVCNVPDYGTTEVADHAAALMLSLVRGTVAYDQRLRAQGGWGAVDMPGVRRLRGLKVGIVGLGRIGLAFARRAQSFDTDISFYDPYLAPGAELAFGYQRHPTLQALMGAVDIISVHVPLTGKTENLIDRDALQAVRPGAMLINTSRGRVVNLDAVEVALREGKLCAAGLDVLPQEPPDYAHSLLQAWKSQEVWLQNRLVVTPHAAFFSPDSITDKRVLTTKTTIDYLLTGRLRSCVNEHLLKMSR